MEEVIISEPNLLQVLVTHPITYIIGVIFLIAWFEAKRKKSSPKSQGANKTSSSSKPRRARGKKGKFVADDPNTPQNEAWVGGKAPKKKATKKTAKKRATKKATRKRTPKKSGE